MASELFSFQSQESLRADGRSGRAYDRPGTDLLGRRRGAATRHVPVLHEQIGLLSGELEGRWVLYRLSSYLVVGVAAFLHLRGLSGLVTFDVFYSFIIIYTSL